jgi:hypothetical protein
VPGLGGALNLLASDVQQMTSMISAVSRPRRWSPPPNAPISIGTSMRRLDEFRGMIED